MRLPMASNSVQGLLANPLFSGGLGLLAGSQPGGNPYEGLLGGLEQSQKHKTEKEESDRDKALRELLAAQMGINKPAENPQPRNEQEAALLQAQAGAGMPGVAPQVQPQGLLGGPTAASVAPVSGPLESASESEIAGADTTDLLEPVGDEAGTPRQQLAQVQTDAVESMPAPVQGLLEKEQLDPLKLFGLLAQYGDPQKAAESYLSYQVAQQRIAAQQSAQAQASQAKTSGFNPVTDHNGRVWFPYRQADGTTGLSPGRSSDGTQIRVDPRFTPIQMGGGGIQMVPTSGGIGVGGRMVVSPQQAQQNEGVAADIEKQQGTRRGLHTIENAVAVEGGAWETVNALINSPARELMTGGSAPVGQVAAMIPGSEEKAFEVMRNKLGNQAFIDSITQLRQAGGTVGQITEREGMKLEQARLSLVNASSEEQFLEELQDFRASLIRFVQSARSEAGVDVNAPYVPGGIDLRSQKQQKAQTVDVPDETAARLQELREKYNID